MSSRKWWFYTVEIAPVGTSGPFGPLSASDEEEARRIAVARAQHSGLTVSRVVETHGQPSGRAPTEQSN